MPEGDENKRITTGVAFAMILVAGLIDGAQALLTVLMIGIIISPILDIFAILLFGTWLSMYGVKVLSPKRALRLGGTFAVEFVPGADIAPLWTLCIVFTVFESRIKGIAARLFSFAKKRTKTPQTIKALAPRGASPARPVEVDEVAEPGNA